ncbi:MAG: HslU--HslV peptidase ATPase subunit, partial [Psychromonas sp.]|nr:HslU--HslV peptidase ATPase subunit [Psychromonas sp.]
FIGSGAFQIAKPSDMIPELQGRMPIRVELEALKEEDLARILTEPKASLSEQYQALLATEGVDIEFTQEGIDKIAKSAWHVNETTENIGARRLHTLMERIMDELSYEASDRSGDSITIDAEYVANALDEVIENEDLSRYIL